MSLATGIAVLFSLVFAVFIGGVTGMGWGKDMVLDTVKKHGRFIYGNDELVGTVSTIKPRVVYPPIPYPASRRPTAPSSTEMP